MHLKTLLQLWTNTCPKPIIFGLIMLKSAILKVFWKFPKLLFADTISVSNSVIKNCERGFMLNKETNDGGDYNAEFVTFSNSTFDNIQEVVLDYYRGGYDESTIGGNLVLESNTITNSGKAEKERILIKNRGIVNVEFNNNTFQNNPVKLIAILWVKKGKYPEKTRL